MKTLKTLALIGAIGTTLVAGLPAHASNETSESIDTTALLAEIGEHGAEMGQSNPQAQEGAVAGASASTLATVAATGVYGMDVSSHQPSINWANEWAKGSRFAYVKATEGTVYKNPLFSSQYSGADRVGMYRGSYHFALPSTSSGAEQARYFIANGGGWTPDGKTLPGLLDVEWNPYASLGNMCFNMSQTQMRNWIKDFVETYKASQGRYPMIYTATNWWNTCVGNTTMFKDVPLHLANYNSTVGAMPYGWSYQTVWQYSSTGPFAGDSNLFNGSMSQLAQFVKGSTAPTTPITQPTTGYKLYGAIGGYYYGNQSTLGVPTSEEMNAPGNLGRLQQFSNKRTVYWSEATGAHAVYNPGDIGWNYRVSGTTQGWGYPSTDEQGWNGGARQFFRAPSGYVTGAYWSPSTGTKTLNANGAIHAKWLNEGGATNGYGFPSMSETAHGSQAALAKFTRNGGTTAVYWTNYGTGTHAINDRGGINAKWWEMGGASRIGYPVTDEQARSEGGAVVYFRNTKGEETGIYWSPSTGSKALNSKGAIYHHWLKNGYISKFGYPTTDEHYDPWTGKVVVKFSKGKTITWSASEGIRVP